MSGIMLLRLHLPVAFSLFPLRVATMVLAVFPVVAVAVVMVMVMLVMSLPVLPLPVLGFISMLRLVRPVARVNFVLVVANPNVSAVGCSRAAGLAHGDTTGSALEEGVAVVVIRPAGADMAASVGSGGCGAEEEGGGGREEGQCLGREVHVDIEDCNCGELVCNFSGFLMAGNVQVFT